ncbi:hypothetical protein FKW77_007135 [Venturia effusa]|uniref:Myb-like domain-containing protein n=1 Tax=Venturia effusa TaxID=50376 RepID=A0A517L3M2_9PEZI|nr:hypothetical protein FKW77_007135 [Venturia effusa]
MPSGQPNGDRIIWDDGTERHLLMCMIADLNPTNINWTSICARFGKSTLVRDLHPAQLPSTPAPHNNTFQQISKFPNSTMAASRNLVNWDDATEMRLLEAILANSAVSGTDWTAVAAHIGDQVTGPACSLVLQTYIHPSIPISPSTQQHTLLHKHKTTPSHTQSEYAYRPAPRRAL